jgi:hypothetical protein
MILSSRDSLLGNLLRPWSATSILNTLCFCRIACLMFLYSYKARFFFMYSCKCPLFRTGLDSTFQFYDPSPYIRQPKLEFQGYFDPSPYIRQPKLEFQGYFHAI